ncbi:hypothetical protein [Nonomuraea sp. GTA35]|uniref:hypothetical protein n=1 Tax=Nonomuraea sp. GTA35 TaxID=1676746 RepID=UPI0035C1DFC7
MAVRFDADAEEYTRTVSLGSITAHSVACWLKISVDRNTISTAWTLDNTFASFYSMVSTNSDGTTIQHDNGSNVHAIGSLTVGTWCYVGLAVNGANATAVMQRVGDAAPTVVTWSNNQTSVNATRLMIGESLFGTQWLNGCVAAFKFWTATLTQAELENEIWTYVPRRTTSLLAWYPFLTPGTVDYSGNAQTLTGGTGTTTEDGPPILWSSSRARLYVPPLDVVQANLDGILPGLAGTSDGTVEVAGTLPATLPGLTATTAGSVEASGNLDAALPALTAALDGETDLPAGELVVTLPALTATSTGDLTVSGQLAGTLPALTGAFTDSISGDFDFAAILRRGWNSRIQPAWAGLDVAAAWAARDITHDWSANATRGWSADTLTL